MAHNLEEARTRFYEVFTKVMDHYGDTEASGSLMERAKARSEFLSAAARATKALVLIEHEIASQAGSANEFKVR